MIRRTLANKLREAVARFPVVTITGPRQSGKTTLVRSEFKDYIYVSLELIDQLAFALEDPRGFLAQFEGPVILDEAQRAPKLFSYIQGIVDERDHPGQFILTGSHNFLLLQQLCQSLVGRSALFHLLPFSLAELSGRPPLSLDTFGHELPHTEEVHRTDLLDLMFTGFYPRIHDKGLPPRDWLGAYYQVNLERDLRNVLDAGNFELFGRFVRLCAGRNGQLLNLPGLAADCGISHTTATRWLSVLQSSFLVMLLRPHVQSFGKRLIKSPKLYFLDTGLLCYLLRVQNTEELSQHEAREAIFESFVLAELHKNFLNRGEPPGLSFWRDSSGHEIDIVIDMGSRLIPVEARSAQTIAGDFFKGLKYWHALRGKTGRGGALVYGGDRAFRRHGAVVYPWFAL